MSDEEEFTEELTPESADDPQDEPRTDPDGPSWDADTEAEARAFGWKPASEWAGEVPAGFISDPKAYISRAETFGPFRKLREQRDADREQYRKLAEVMAGQIKRNADREKADYEAKLAAITERQRRAVDEADRDAFDAAEKDRESLKAPEAPPEFEVEEKPQASDPVAEFGDKHAWVKDPYLLGQGAALIDAGFQSGALLPSASKTEQVAFAEKQLKVYFPQMFDKPAPRPSPVEGGKSMAAGKQRSGGFEALSADAKAAFREMVSLGIFKDTDKDRQEYYDEYQNA